MNAERFRSAATRRKTSPLIQRSIESAMLGAWCACVGDRDQEERIAQLPRFDGERKKKGNGGMSYVIRLPATSSNVQCASRFISIGILFQPRRLWSQSLIIMSRACRVIRRTCATESDSWARWDHMAHNGVADAKKRPERQRERERSRLRQKGPSCFIARRSLRSALAFFARS